MSNELLVSTNNMLVNAGAIGRSLQEMGGVVADVSYLLVRSSGPSIVPVE